MIDPTPFALAPWRQRSDPLADEIISTLYAERTLNEANQVLSQLVLNDRPDPANTPAVLQRYLSLTSQLPGWTDYAAIDRAQKFFAERGPLILMSLVTCSLAECYALKKGVQVLYTTHRMDERHVYRRIYETAQFIIDTCFSGGLATGGRGVRSIQKVRLMHGSIRHLLLAPTPATADPASRAFSDVLLATTWNTPELGRPINFEDQAFTLLSFSWMTLRSLERFKVDTTAQEASDWMHLWAVIGHLLGIPAELTPQTTSEAEQLYEAIRASQAGATPQGDELTRALGTFVAEKLHSPWLGRQLTTMLLRLLCDERAATDVGVRPLKPEERWLISLLRRSTGLIWRHPDNALHAYLGRCLVTQLTKLPREWRRGLFQIPDSLITAWSR